MASGSFCNNVSQNCNLIISWNSVKGQGGSTVNATLIAQNRNGWYFDAVVYGYGITINGSQVTGSGARLSASSNGSSGLISHSVWVPYTGNKSINISGYANFNGIINLSNQSISGTVTLDKIGSAPTMGSVTAPTTSTVSEKTTSITVRWNKASSYNNSVTYAIGCSINGGSYEWRYPDNNINTTSYTWDIGTPTQGATYQFAVCCANDIARSDYKYSGTITINKLSPPTIGDIGTYNPYTNSTLTIPLSGGSTTNGENFVRMCDLYYGDTWLCSAKSYNDTPWKNTSQDILYAAANYASNLGTKAYSSNKFKITAWIENANRSRSSYVSKTFAVNINSDGGATPTLSLPTISGGAFNNAATCFIAGISTLNVSSPAASLRRAPSGTTISYKIACTGATTQNSQNANFSGLTAGTKTITVTATDSRGLSVSVSKQVVVQSYAAPTIRAFTATRLDDPNTSAKLVYTLAYSPIYQYTDVNTKGNQLNGISLQQYKKNNFDWSTASNELVLTNLETDSTYAIKLRIADKVKTTTYITATQVIPTIKTTMAWRSWGVGIGCIPQNGYNLDVTGKARFQGSVIYNVGGRDREPITMLTGDANGDGIKIGAGGTVVIGSGESPSKFISGSEIGGNSETTYITSDSAIGFETNLNGSYDDKQEFTMHTDGQMTIPSHLNLGGSLKMTASSSSWINGRDNAKIKISGVNGYSPAITIPTPNGSWEIGTYEVNEDYNDCLLFSYTKDTDYAAGNNRTTRQYRLSPGVKNSNDLILTLGMAFPVGAVYITYNNNNPGNFLGGTWVQFGQGRTLIGQGTGNDGSTSMSFTTAGDTGGKYKTSHSHTTSFGWDNNAFFAGRPDGAANNNYSRTSIVANGYVIQTASSPTSASRLNWTEDKAVNHIQPYITVFFWRRTA